MLLATALLKRVAGQPEVASRYLAYLGITESAEGSAAESKFDDAGYYEVLEDENYATYLNSNVRLVEHIGDNRELSICDIGCGRGQFLTALETAGFTNCVGYEISPEAVDNAVHPSVRLIKSLKDIDATFDIVTLISVLEHIPPNDLAEFLEGVRGLTKKYLVACIPTYPRNMFDFFDNDPTHVNLERREWWDGVLMEHGFQPQERPPDLLPFIQPFIYRTVPAPLARISHHVASESA